jgi:hypothetical protein
VCIGVIVDWGMTPIEEAPTTEDAQEDPEQEAEEVSKAQNQGAGPGGEEEPPEDEEGARESTVKGYNQHGGGKNAKHSNPDAREAARLKWEEAKKELEQASRAGATKKEKKILEDRVKHWKRKMDFSGEHHSQKPKGPR